MTARRIMILTSRSPFPFSSDGALRVGGAFGERNCENSRDFVLEKSRKYNRIQEWQFTLEGNAMYLDFRVKIPLKKDKKLTGKEVYHEYTVYNESISRW